MKSDRKLPTQNEESEIKPESQLLNRTISFPAGKHIWRQQGPYVVCQNCPLHHAVFIGMDKVMIGEEEDGKPVLRAKASI